MDSSSRVRPLSVLSAHRTPRKGLLQPLYVGIELEPLASSPRFCIYVHDGYYGMDYTIREISKSPIMDIQSGDEPDILQFFTQNLREMESEVISWLRDYAETSQSKIMVAGIGVSYGYQNLCRTGGEVYLCHRVNIVSKLKLPARLWAELDILPILVETKGATADERACAAVRKSLPFIVQGSIGSTARIFVGFRHRVEVDADYRIHLADLDDYERVTPKDIFNQLLVQAGEVKELGLKVNFFNSTPQGGGVATMRHALLRLFGLLEMPIGWYVARPKPEVFEITKKKMHNVLQGVAPDSVVLTDDDKRIYEAWCRTNVERDWALGPYVESDIIVIDDAQLAGTIPLIRECNPACKIIFRLHIQLDLRRMEDPDTNTHQVWCYLWSFIKLSDAIVCHPLFKSMPPCMTLDKLYLMPAVIDPFDGLNKFLDAKTVEYYQAAFNRLAFDVVGKRLDFRVRPIIAQFARFDPSKGINDVIRSYAKLRLEIDAVLPMTQIPQLLLTGFGSIDDPEGHAVYQQTLDFIDSEEFSDIERDIIACRLPPSDQLMNALLQCTRICLQLSTREGFEIKVTEALAKGVPVIAYRTGGLSNQIRDEETGFLAEAGDTDKVAHLLKSLLTDHDLYASMSKKAKHCLNPQFSTPFQATNWLWLWKHVYQEKSVEEPDICVMQDGVNVAEKVAVRDVAQMWYHTAEA